MQNFLYVIPALVFLLHTTRITLSHFLFQGFKMNVSSGKDLANSLNDAVIENDTYFNTMLRIMTTRCMMQAKYFCSGMIPESEYLHYGLATEIYTHFTSPIRRYDLADSFLHWLNIFLIYCSDIIFHLFDQFIFVLHVHSVLYVAWLFQWPLLPWTWHSIDHDPFV